MIPLIIGAGVGLAKTIAGGIGAGQARRKMDAYLNRQDAENKAWYNANALSDYTQRADTQNLMRQLRDTLSRQNKRAAGSAVVTGATGEQQAVQKELSNKVISDTFSNIGALGQRYKDSVTDRYLAMKNNYANQRMGMLNREAASYENVMQSGFDTLGNSFGGTLGSVGSTAADKQTNLAKLPTL